MNTKSLFLAAFAKNFPIMGINWATGLRFRPVTNRFKTWYEEHLVVNCHFRFKELYSPETLYFISYLRVLSKIKIVIQLVSILSWFFRHSFLQ